MATRIPFPHLTATNWRQGLHTAVGVDGEKIQHGRFLAAKDLEAQLLPIVWGADQLCHLTAVCRRHRP
ncbi:hypothetical protein [Microbulbifer magnicolonia]|uniref:hypothetical protein n=1 Tax=Microbulbifer magnicolonia TaxID=3109744 RepID=UPI002B416E8A|nr:hypothetical protein [Microbulbifer sp. GG15]